MCTSFVFYAEKTYIGMNFDISDRAIKLGLRGDDQLIVFQQENSRFLPAIGINDNGTFVNLLMVDPIDAGVYRRGKNCVHIIRLFDGILGKQLDLADLGEYLQDKTVVNVPQISVHSMIAGRGRRACVVEPGRSNILLEDVGEDFMVLTNFPLSDFVRRDYREVDGVGSDRYIACYSMLAESKNLFNVERGFSILETVSQSGGDFPTQLSLVALVEDGVVNFTIKREFKRQYVFSFKDKTVRTSAGFESSNQWVLGRSGLPLSDLASGA
jgi:hypothetical protein